MSNTEQNKGRWDKTYDWQRGGDEWSADFGGTEALWFFILYPRIHRFIPAPTILEIAPGFGRWTQFLKAQCQSLTAVDISQKCIDHCKLRFASDPHVQFHLNDGTSLAMVPDNSVDFVFSFDSLVHVEKDVVEAYISQVACKLTPDGIGFIHHSNLGAYPGRANLVKQFNRLPDSSRIQASEDSRVRLAANGLEALLSINLQANRGSSMTGKLFREHCQEAGLKCIGQELLNWVKGSCLIDSISVFTRSNSRWTRDAAYLDNTEFAEMSRVSSQLAKLYCV
jgi:2-polyprenyl-3-methyl-5-hydroxy-6-metoxy-1,4-benzoquinol methylase